MIHTSYAQKIQVTNRLTENFDTNFSELGLTKGRSWFLNFLGAPMILIMEKVYLLRVR